MRRIVTILILLIPFSCLGDSISLEDRKAIEETLTSPITLKLKNGQKITGHPIEVDEVEIKIASAEGAGEIIFTFKHEQIEAIEIPGESFKSLAIEWMNKGKSAQALELMHLLFQQRKALLHIMPPSESNFFVLYIQLILDSPDPARAIGASSRLRAQIENPLALRALDNAILESYQRLKIFDEAIPLARKLIRERQAHVDCSYSYYVLGCQKLRDAEYEQALQLSLQPIVFSSLLSGDELAYCYAVAASAAYELRERDYAGVLLREMKSREFSWPTDDETLSPYFEKIETYLSENETD